MGQIEIVETSPPRQPGPAGSETDLQSQIGQQLRAVYDTVLSQPVPDRFVELLNELDTKTGATKDEA